MTMHLHPIHFVQDALPAEFDNPVQHLGRKGMSLRHLAEVGLRVPRGFTVRTEVCRQFLDSDGHWPEGVWDAIVAGVERLESETGLLFFPSSGGSDPLQQLLRLAVRSGAAESMPGLLKTYLGVGSTHSMADELSETLPDPWMILQKAIEGVFRSWNEDAAVDYRRANGVHHLEGTAVTVQEMITCDISGVLFTQSPGRDGTETMTVEAVAGLGDKLVAGRSDPDRWTVSRNDLQPVPSANNSATTLDDLACRLPELCRVGLQLEETFGRPVDIEWGMDQAGLVFFQARPISTFASAKYSADIRQQEFQRLQGLAANGARMWVRHNLDETLPYPTPLSWSLWRQFMSGSGGLGTLYRRLGYRPSKRADQESFLVLIGGRIFADPDRAIEMFGERSPFQYDEAALRTDPTVLDRAPTHFNPDHADPWLLWRLPASLWKSIRVRRRLSELYLSVADRFEQQILPSYLRTVIQERQRDLTSFDRPDLFRLFESRRRLVLDEFAPESLLPGMLGVMAYSEFVRQLTCVLGPDEGQSLAQTLVPPGDAELLRRQQELIAACHTSPAGIDAFLEEFGHRAIGEMELAVPRWREAPQWISQLAPNCRESPLELEITTPSMGGSDSYRMVVERLHREFVNAGASSVVADAEIWLKRCWGLLPYRDRGKHLLLKGYELLRHVSEELAQRFDLGSLFYQLTPEEWVNLSDGQDLSPLIKKRRKQAKVHRQLVLPQVIEANNLEALIRSDEYPLDSQKTFNGTPLAGGQATGAVCQSAAADLFEKDLSNRVLVCQSLEPSLSPVLGQLSAIVVEQGGSLSHGALLARQWGLPVVRLPGAAQLLPSGRRLHVDGDSGRITIIHGDPS